MHLSIASRVCRRHFDAAFRFLAGRTFGEIIDSNKALIPQAVDQFGQLGPLFDKFLLGTSDEAPEPHDYSTSKHARPNAIKMNKLACSTKVP